MSTISVRNVHNHVKVEKTSATFNNKRLFEDVLWELKHGMDGWLLVTPRYFCHAKEIDTSWLYPFKTILLFLKSFHTFSKHNKRIFAATRSSLLQLVENISNNPLLPSHPKEHLVNVCCHKFACRNQKPKRRNGAHFITHAPYCAWVIRILRLTDARMLGVSVDNLLFNNTVML